MKLKKVKKLKKTKKLDSGETSYFAIEDEVRKKDTKYVKRKL